MQASLILVKADGSTAAVALSKPRTVIGRDVSCQVRIPKPDVSREHCEILVAPGRVAMRDLGSSNGSFVNGERVSEAQLSAGDMVGIGSCFFVVQVDGSPSEDEAIEHVRALARSAQADGGADASEIDDEFAGLGALSSDDSSVMDFDFDLDDDDDDKQPAL